MFTVSFIILKLTSLMNCSLSAAVMHKRREVNAQRFDFVQRGFFLASLTSKPLEYICTTNFRSRLKLSEFSCKSAKGFCVRLLSTSVAVVKAFTLFGLPFEWGLSITACDQVFHLVLEAHHHHHPHHPKYDIDHQII